MIKTIEGADWENYPYFCLDLSSGVNIIIGKSHSGKSSIIRACNWVLANRPQGTPFFPHGKRSPKTEVSIEFGDINVQKSRGKSVNEYTIGDSKFEALRSGVPEQVKEASNMSDINLQSQKDVHYFLSEAWSAGKRAKTLNEIVNLEEMDLATEVINSTVSSIDAEHKRTLKDIDTKSKQIETLKWVKKASEELEEIVEFSKALSMDEQDIQKLETVIDSIKVLVDKRNSLPDYSAMPAVNEILAFDDAILAKERQEEKVKKITENLRDLISSKMQVSLHASIDTSNFDTISAKISSGKVVLSSIENLCALLDMKGKAEKVVEMHSKTFSDTLKEMGRCPLCESEV